MKNIRFVLAILLLGSLAVSLPTCGSSSSSGGGGAASSSSARLSSLSVSAAIPVGSTQKFAAIGTYSDGNNRNLTPLVTWTSSNPSVATVNSSGLAISLAAGTTTITATFQTISGSMTLTTRSAALSSIALTPANPSVPGGVNQQFTALGIYSDGTKHDITPLVTWTSSNPSVATVDSSGLATSVAVGTATITAAAGSISGRTTLTVYSATLTSISVTPTYPNIVLQDPLQFTALGSYSDGTSHDLTTQVTWTSNAPAVATISGSGMATAMAAGTATITATFQTISGNTILTATSVTLSSIAYLTPSIPVGAILQLVAIGTNTDGSTADITQLVSWTSNAPAVATISGGGLATAVAAGESVLLATTQNNYFPYLPVNVVGATILLVTP